MNPDSADQKLEATEIFLRLAALLENRLIHAGTFDHVEDKNVSLTIVPDEGHDARDHTVVIRCSSVPPSQTAGSHIQLLTPDSNSVVRRGWLDRRGTVRLPNVPIGEYRLVVTPRPREQLLDTSRISQTAEELICNRPIEFSLGRFHVCARQHCLILLWEPIRPGAGGSARITYDTDSSPGDGELLIPGDPDFWIVPWRQRDKDFRLCLEATGEFLVLPTSCLAWGIDYVAVARFVLDWPTLVERLNDLERRVAAQLPSMPLGALPLGSAGHVMSLAASSAGPATSSSSSANLEEYITYLRNGASVKFDYPEHLIPYGVIRIEVFPKTSGPKSATDRIAIQDPTTRSRPILLPMKSIHNMRTNSIPFSRLSSTYGPKDVDIIAVSPGNPAMSERENQELLSSFDPQEVERLLEDSYVATRPALAADLRRLVTDIRRAQGGSGDSAIKNGKTDIS